MKTLAHRLYQPVIQSSLSSHGLYSRMLFILATSHFNVAKVYQFKQKRQNKFYEEKRVEVFYIVERDRITITVYVFYGKWEG
jgi:hypothetical protein